MHSSLLTQQKNKVSGNVISRAAFPCGNEVFASFAFICGRSSGIIGPGLSASHALSRSPLWRCERCGREFANRNQSHACGRHDLAHHFEGKPPEIRALFDAVVAAIRAIGPVEVLPEKTRIAFHVRMSFAQVTPRGRWLDGHVVLARRCESPRFRRIETFSPRNHLHAFRLEKPEDIDAEFRDWLAEAYAVGEQRHLSKQEKRSQPG